MLYINYNDNTQYTLCIVYCQCVLCIVIVVIVAANSTIVHMSLCGMNTRGEGAKVAQYTPGCMAWSKKISLLLPQKFWGFQVLLSDSHRSLRVEWCCLDHY